MTPVLGDFLDTHAIKVAIDEYEVPIGVLQFMAAEFGVDCPFADLDMEDILVLTLTDGSEVRVAPAEMLN